MFDWLLHYSYAGLFAALMFGIAGLPIPDETFLVFCGYLVATGRMNWGGALATGIAGSICGITVSYLIGRSAGHALVLRYGRYVRITQRQLDDVHGWFRRFGHWLLTFGYFILGVRHLSALAAGLSDLEYGVFARYAYSGAVLWVGTFLGIGYVLGDRWQAAMVLVHRYSWWLLIVGICAAALYLLIRQAARSRR